MTQHDEALEAELRAAGGCLTCSDGGCQPTAPAAVPEHERGPWLEPPLDGETSRSRLGPEVELQAGTSTECRHEDRPPLEIAGASLVDGERRRDYGDPVENLGRIGAAWAAILGLPEPISARHAALMMVALKLVREGQGNRHKVDNLEDAAGYLHIADLAARQEGTG